MRLKIAKRSVVAARLLANAFGVGDRGRKLPAPQFGLVAEDVEEINPDLVVRDREGKVNTVRYEAVNAMLLNEFLNEHRKVEEQEATITELKSAVMQQQKEIKALSASLKEQAAQIQEVSDQIAASKCTPRLVANNQ